MVRGWVPCASPAGAGAGQIRFLCYVLTPTLGRGSYRADCTDAPEELVQPLDRRSRGTLHVGELSGEAGNGGCQDPDPWFG
jgi:hypothetical protein